MAISTTNTSSNLQNKTQKKQTENKKPEAAAEEEELQTGIHQTIDSSVKTYSCHQCRQRTANLMAFCKNERSNKPCSIKLCYKCLLNRYGEKAEEVSLLENWKCPKCRDICNCSLCMKKKGHRPTGILVRTAKATGFSSVSEMLIVKGHENLISEEVVKDVGTSTKSPVASSKEKKVESSMKHGKENSFDGNSDLNVEKNLSTSGGDSKKTVKKKRRNLEMNDTSCSVIKGSKGEDAKLEKGAAVNPKLMKKDEDINAIDDDFVPEVKNFKKSRCSEQTIPCPIKEEATMTTKNDVGLLEKTDSQISKETSVETSEEQEKVNEREESLPASDETKVPIVSKEMKMSKETDGEDSLLSSDEMKVPETKNVGNGQAKLKTSPAVCRTKKNALEIHSLDCRADISLPQGINLTAIAGIDLPAEDVGHALQFLEFCKGFGKVFDLKKGHPESYLRELTRTSSRRRRQYSPVIQFQIELLSMIQEDLGEESSLSQTSSGNSWLQALEKCISQSHCTFEELPSNCFDKSGNGYEQLDPSKKLRLLNFLCDEALNTEEMRSWIDEEHTKFIESEKEAKQKVAAAKDKEKCLKQKLQDEMVKGVLLKSGSPSMLKLDNLASALKVEVANAHTEVLQAIENLPKKKQRVEAAGTEPLLLDGNGHILWRLRGYSCDPDTLLQDIGSWDSVTLEDKWFAYDSEQKQAVEECISLSRKRVRVNVVPNKQSLETSEESLRHESSDDQSSPVNVKEDSQGNAEETRLLSCSHSNSS